MTRRLVVTYVSLTVLVAGLLGIPLALAYQHDVQHERTLQVQGGTSTLATLVDDSLEHADSVTVPILAERYSTELNARIAVVDEHGRILGSAGGSVPFARILEAAGPAAASRAVSGSAAGVRYVAAPVSGGGHVIAVYRSVGVNGSVRGYWLLIGLLAAVAVLAAIVIGIGLARTITRPLRSLEQATAAAGEGRLATRVPESGPPELRSLARSFNHAAANLERVLAAQAAWVSDASHQLRTPLAALQLRLENLQRGSEPQPDPEALEAALGEVHRLTRLTDGLLALGRLDGGTPAGHRIALEPLIRERVALWRTLADEHGVGIVANVTGDPVVASEEGRIEQVLDNLLSNALDASTAGVTITVNAFPSNGQVEIHVVDEGDGLSPEELRRAFDRFWRGGSGDGSGLGLAIVRQLVTADHGRVELRTAPSGGIDAVVQLPRVDAPAARDPRRTRGQRAAGPPLRDGPA